MTVTSTTAVFLTGVSILAMSVVPGLATGAHPAIETMHGIAHGSAHKTSDRTLDVLYDQTSNPSGGGTLSQGMGSVYTSRAADDFTVPADTHWTIREIDVTGSYLNGAGSAPSVEVTVYKNKHHKPGMSKFDVAVVPASDDNGSFTLTLGENGIRLDPGHYWLSIVANMDFDGFGEWFWQNQTPGTIEGDPAVWENPMDGLDSGCTTWTVESKCGGSPAGDQMFVLKGNAE
jgi:hypothetical protein